MTGVPAVVGLGEVMLRLSPPRGRRIENADFLRVHAAGAESNVLAALARLGVPVQFVTALPNNGLGRRAVAELSVAGVGLDHVEWIDGARMGTFFVEPGAGARRANVLYDRAGSAFAERIRWPAGILRGAEYAVVSGITPALSPLAADAAHAMADETERTGARLCVDVNYRSKLWSPDAARAALAPLLARAALVVCSESDARIVFDCEEADPITFRREHAPCAEICVITTGRSGCWAVGDGDVAIKVDSIPTAVLDPLGLGDALLAGLLDGLLRELDLKDSLRVGAALAALKATVEGDLSLARRDELDVLERRTTQPRVLR